MWQLSEEFLWKNPWNHRILIFTEIVSDKTQSLAGQPKIDTLKNRKCYCLKAGFGMGLSEKVSEKKDCLKSEKSFHDDTNI